MSIIDSPLAYRFVAAPDHWGRGGAGIRAVMIHMAEGGGTVSWLTRDDGNSSHYVVDYDGRITQMVRESEAAGSTNASALRIGNDRAFTFEGESVVYGRTVLDRCVRSIDVNRYIIAIEVEGFAGRAPLRGERGFDARAAIEGGPNGRQRASLKALIADIRRRRGAIPAIGHRDQQTWKACPGRRIPWQDYGGHGVVPTAEEKLDMAGPTVLSPEPCVGTATIIDDGKPNAALHLDDGRPYWLPEGTTKPIVAKGRLATPWPLHPSGIVYLCGDEWAVLLHEDVTVKLAPDPTAALKAQIAALQAQVDPLKATNFALTQDNARLTGLLSEINELADQA